MANIELGKESQVIEMCTRLVQNIKRGAISIQSSKDLNEEQQEIVVRVVEQLDSLEKEFVEFGTVWTELLRAFEEIPSKI